MTVSTSQLRSTLASTDWKITVKADGMPEQSTVVHGSANARVAWRDAIDRIDPTIARSEDFATRAKRWLPDAERIIGTTVTVDGYTLTIRPVVASRLVRWRQDMIRDHITAAMTGNARGRRATPA